MIEHAGPVLAVPIQRPNFHCWADAVVPVQGAYTLAQHLAEYDRIPAEIREVFEAPRLYPHDSADQTQGVVRSLSIHFGFDDAGADGRAVAGRYTGDIWVTSRARTRTLVHEFGHHVDYMFNRMAAGGNGSRQPLSTLPEWQQLWNDVRPGIPSGNYAGESSVEWFAELFAWQVLDDASAFLRAAGNTVARARAVRAAFLAVLPMRTPFHYD
ncbi:hypothetical protein BKA24_001699 [Microbacterium marinum]|uniref:Uncharacterized protein n=1 Tax=Microbacterium marinum TaxID=421115 RepID=A0A7W7BQM6_9MICO|nr:hypothetical protein [Microbacterium marinum]MBB4666990.1 hypothetical protein [Microbacterium marinum]